MGQMSDGYTVCSGKHGMPILPESPEGKGSPLLASIENRSYLCMYYIDFNFLKIAPHIDFQFDKILDLFMSTAHTFKKRVNVFQLR